MAGSLQVCFDLSISQDGLSVGTPDVLHETICVIDVDLAISDCLLESYLAPPEVIEIQASVGDRIATRYRTSGMGSRKIIPGRLKTAREELARIKAEAKSSALASASNPTSLLVSAALCISQVRAMFKLKTHLRLNPTPL